MADREPAGGDAHEPPPPKRVSLPRPLPVDAVPWGVRAAAEWAARLIILAVAVYLVLWAFDKVSLVAFSFLLAMFFTAVLQPLVVRLNRLGVPRALAATIVLLAGMAVVALIVWFVVEQISAHSSQLSDQAQEVVDKIKHWLQTGPLHVREKDLDSLSSKVTDALKSHQGEIVSSALTTARAVAEFAGGLLLALISTFFLLRDGESVWGWVLGVVPRSARDRVDTAGRRGWTTLGGYMRGQVTIAVIHAVSITVLLAILRVPLAVALGVLIFLGSFVPILGLTITGALCVGVTLLEHGTGAAIAVAIAIVILVQVESNVLQPLIMSRAVHIHPLAVALSVAAGTTLYGITGALIAVPTVAFTNSFVRGLRQEAIDPMTEDPAPDESPEGDVAEP
jgi:putative heme transporter